MKSEERPWRQCKKRAISFARVALFEMQESETQKLKMDG